MAYFQKVPAKNKQGYKWKCTKEAPRNPITGERRQVTRRSDTKKDAEKKVDEGIKEIIRKDAKGLTNEISEIKVSELFDKWFELVMKRRIKETTYREYTNAYNYRILPVLGQHKVTNLNTILLQKYINDLSDEGLSPRYVEYINTILYGALECARKWGIIDNNPLRDVERPRPRRREQKVWSLEEANKFLSVMKLEDFRLYMIVNIALYTGCRRGELLSLKWTDLDQETNNLSIERTLIYDKDGFRFSSPKSEASIRKIKLGQTIIKELDKWKNHQNKLKMAHRNQFQENDLIFTTNTGKPLFPRSLTTDFNKGIKTAVVPKIRFHDLRHTHATMCLEAGMGLKEVQVRLGHTSIKTTGDVYAHVTETMKEKSVDLFEKYISKI